MTQQSMLVSGTGPVAANSSEIQQRINALRTIDNWTNWYYIVREYLLVGSIVALTIFFYQSREGWGLHWLWNIPVSLLAIFAIGACQHRLTTLAHEASHYMLFRNRKLNELASDWLCMFPMWSTTHTYRLQHLAHHQHVNHPELDPDITQMEESGHRFKFPMARAIFVWKCVIKQLLWWPNLIRYIRVRARYSALSGGTGPYYNQGPRSPLLIVIGVLYLAGLAGTLTGLVMLGNPLLLALVPVGLWALVEVVFYLAPDRLYPSTAVKPDISRRWMSIGRTTFLTGVFVTLAWLTYLTGRWWAIYYLVLWLVPIGTTFSFFMILRQVVQHGNAGSDRFTNTRIFRVGRLIGMAVFPIGMDYHLPHHLYPMVPHFRLRQLHRLLLNTTGYREHATEVDGYFFHSEHPPIHPTVLDLMAQDRLTQIKS